MIAGDRGDLVYRMLTQAAEKVFLAREMAKSGGSEMYPQGSAIAYGASNRVDDFAFGIDRDFFRSLSQHAVLKYRSVTVAARKGVKFSG